MTHDDDLPDDGNRGADGISVADEGDGTLVTLWGEVDASLREQASASMIEVARRGGPVVIDASRVRFIDSTGIAFVIQLHRLGDEGAQLCTLRNPPHHVLDLLEMVGLQGHLRIERTDEALAASSGPATGRSASGDAALADLAPTVA
ncbi:STAS domain-containing protein [Actinotalea sp. K2]|uniref:STAS domain-containing protein n=1 Tax=Actinotalea sp. K2 TaxID=2939438 RepID=UPI0020178999|nr:STAS domain-containing protein [Actinotalea sp. K2]MCL3860943.1 STAS domain-containing protein [Actinotalea sp. K2]